MGHWAVTALGDGAMAPELSPSSLSLGCNGLVPGRALSWTLQSLTVAFWFCLSWLSECPPHLEGGAAYAQTAAPRPGWPVEGQG